MGEEARLGPVRAPGTLSSSEGQRDLRKRALYTFGDIHYAHRGSCSPLYLAARLKGILSSAVSGYISPQKITGHIHTDCKSHGTRDQAGDQHDFT